MTINTSPIATKERGDINDTITAEVLTIDMTDGTGTALASTGTLNLGTIPTLTIAGTNTENWDNVGWLTIDTAVDNYVHVKSDTVIDNFMDIKTSAPKSVLVLFDIYKPGDIGATGWVFSYGKNGTSNNAEGQIQITLLNTTQKIRTAVTGSDGGGGTSTQWVCIAGDALSNTARHTVGVFYDFANGSIDIFQDAEGTASASAALGTDTTIMPTISTSGLALFSRATTTTPGDLYPLAATQFSQMKIIKFDSDMSSKIGQIVADQYNMPWDYSWEMEDAS